LLSNFGRRLGIQAKVRKCDARASCHQRALTGACSHQVILPARLSQRGNGYQEIHEFYKDLSICSRIIGTQGHPCVRWARMRQIFASRPPGSLEFRRD
jgi:hypothetical protein